MSSPATTVIARLPASGALVLAAVLVTSTPGRVASGPSVSGRFEASRQAPAGSPSFDVAEQSVTALLNAMRQGRVTSRQLVEAYFARIAKYDESGPELNAFVVLNNQALDVAAGLDRERQEGRTRGPLHGIPIVVADNLATADMPTTAGLRALEGFTPGRDAFVVERLRARGVVVLGKANMDDLGASRAGVSSHGGQTRNPYDPSRNPGGAGSGVAVAVAASLAAAGLASDTDGGLRMAAAHTGLVAVRPTPGLVSRHGVIPLAGSQDVVGPLARTMTDALILLDAIVAMDPNDPLTKVGQGHVPPTYGGEVGDSSLGDVQVGLLTGAFGHSSEEAEVSALVQKAVASLEHMGAGVTSVAMPNLDELLRNTSTVPLELEPDLREFLAAFPSAPVQSVDQILSNRGFHRFVEPTLRQAVAFGAERSVAREEILARRAALTRAVLDAMRLRNLTALAYPVVRRPPSMAGTEQDGSNGQLSAATQLPAVVVPAGLTANGLPVGVELLGAPFAEGVLLKIAYAYERAVAPRRTPALR